MWMRNLPIRFHSGLSQKRGSENQERPGDSNADRIYLFDHCLCGPGFSPVWSHRSIVSEPYLQDVLIWLGNSFIPSDGILVRPSLVNDPNSCMFIHSLPLRCTQIFLTQRANLVMFQAVGCDGIIGSDRRHDQCGVCEGDSSTCQRIRVEFFEQNLPAGSNKIGTIPKGACNVSLTEQRATGNVFGE